MSNHGSWTQNKESEVVLSATVLSVVRSPFGASHAIKNSVASERAFCV